MSDPYKGIALFTPGGDLVYCLDRTKSEHWHLHLCFKLQEILNLADPPHFLVPHYSATIDRTCDSQTGIITTWAEIHPAVVQHKTFLESVFDTYDLPWVQIPWQDESSAKILLESYRVDFPELWQCHDLIVPYNSVSLVETSTKSKSEYMLTLFVAGGGSVTKGALQFIYELLEKNLSSQYTLKVVDIFKNPEKAEIFHISATPTLVRTKPEPMRKIVGFVDNPQKVLRIITS
ncbi:MAG: circadian clock KaiB family protein [Cyanobacteriota bacterium ELA615]